MRKALGLLFLAAVVTVAVVPEAARALPATAGVPFDVEVPPDQRPPFPTPPVSAAPLDAPPFGLGRVDWPPERQPWVAGGRPGQIEFDVWHPRAEELGLEQAFFRLQLDPGSGPPVREGPLAPLARLGEDGEPSPLSLPLVASPTAVEHASLTRLVPEPASGWLVAAGATALALLRRRRARR